MLASYGEITNLTDLNIISLCQGTQEVVREDIWAQITIQNGKSMMIENGIGNYEITEKWHLASSRTTEWGGEKTLKLSWGLCLI